LPRLIIIKGADLGKNVDIDAQLISIGRDSGNTVRLHDTEVSRKHAELHREPDGSYRLVDVGSANGTLVNTKPARNVVLQTGDHIQVGKTILVYSAGRQNQEAPPGNLVDRIRLISKRDDGPPDIVTTIGEAEGSRILAKPDDSTSPWLKNRLANLSVMYETIQAISHILDISQLLNRILELLSQTIQADRGCVLLHNLDTGAFEPHAVRFRDGGKTGETIGISRTIVDYVLRERQGVLVSDARRDDRFSAGQSIARLGIRESICVPMKGRHETIGVLYLDCRFDPRRATAEEQPISKFNNDHLMLAIAVAHQAALAVEDTRFHQALVNAERLAAVGQTIAVLSHHIKNILQGLRSGGEILHMGIDAMDHELLQRGWRIVEKNQGKIYELVMDMLTYSKEREPQVEATDLNRLVDDVVELVSVRARELQIQIEPRLDRSIGAVPIDPEAVHRALLNLVSNAMDAVSEQSDGRVILQTSVEDDGEWIHVIVSDNGVGVSADRLESIFKPFVSTKGSRGTGLGLAVSRKIAREHGGELTVQSEIGKGSRFTLRLPAKSPLTVEPNADETRVLEPPDAN
jgi:signal transduction histidine kinase